MKPTFIKTHSHRIHRAKGRTRIFQVPTPSSKKLIAMAWKVSINSIAFLCSNSYLNFFCNFANCKDMGKDFVDRYVIETRFRCKSGGGNCLMILFFRLSLHNLFTSPHLIFDNMCHDRVLLLHTHCVKVV